MPAPSFRAWRHEAYRFGRRRGLGHEDAEDVAQEVLIRVWRSAVWRGGRSVAGLVVSATRRAVATFFRREFARKRDRRRLVAIGHDDVAVEDAGRLQQEGWELAERLRDGLSQLGVGRMKAALLLRMEGDSYDEIARKIGARVHDVTNALHKARKRLRSLAAEA